MKLAESYLAKAIEPRRRASYVRDVRRYLLVDAAPLHDLPVAAITRKRIAALLDDMASRAPVAADRCRVALSTLFTWAMKQGLAEANPAAAVARVVEPKARERALSAEELRAVWQATGGPGRLQRGRAAAHADRPAPRGGRRHGVGGNRRQGAGKAVWSLPGARTKNGRPHDVPLSAAALAVLEGTPARDGRALVFGLGEGGFSGWSKGKAALDARIAANRAKAAGRAEAERRGRAGPWRLHDLRRSVVTHMAEIGIQPHVIEAVVNHISGHKGGSGRRLQSRDLRRRKANRPGSLGGVADGHGSCRRRRWARSPMKVDRGPSGGIPVVCSVTAPTVRAKLEIARSQDAEVLCRIGTTIACRPITAHRLLSGHYSTAKCRACRTGRCSGIGRRLLRPGRHHGPARPDRGPAP